MAARILKINRKTLYEIVKEIRNRPCLWDTDNEYYNNRGKSAVAWLEITKTLNLPEPLVRAKWKNMRDLFKRELKKYNVNSLKDYTGKWRHFNVMWFLHKPSFEDGKDSDTSSETQIKQEDDDSLKRDQRTSSGVYGSAGTDVASEAEDSLPACRIFPEGEEFQQDASPTKKRRMSEEDYDMMFLKSLAPYFRNLDPIKKLKIRSKIQDIILTEISY